MRRWAFLLLTIVACAPYYEARRKYDHPKRAMELLLRASPDSAQQTVLNAVEFPGEYTVTNESLGIVTLTEKMSRARFPLPGERITTTLHVRLIPTVGGTCAVVTGTYTDPDKKEVADREVTEYPDNESTGRSWGLLMDLFNRIRRHDADTRRRAGENVPYDVPSTDIQFPIDSLARMNFTCQPTRTT